jgi:hypothetical protein
MLSSCVYAFCVSLCVMYFDFHHSILFPFPQPLHSSVVPSLDSLTFYTLYSCSVIIVVNIMLGLYSTNEQKHVVFGLWSLAYFAQHDNLQLHLFFCKRHFFFMARLYVCAASHLLYPFISCWVLGLIHRLAIVNTDAINIAM